MVWWRSLLPDTFRRRTTNGDGRRHVCSFTYSSSTHFSIFMIWKHTAPRHPQKSLARAGARLLGTPHALRDSDERSTVSSHHRDVNSSSINDLSSLGASIISHFHSFIHFLSPKLLTTTNPEPTQAMPCHPCWLLVYLGYRYFTSPNS